MTRELHAPDRIEAARRAQAEFGLCDACLGRRFAKVETGLTNEERGVIVREAADVASVPAKSCFVCEGLTGEWDALAQVAVEAMAPYEHATFLIGTRFDPALESREADANTALDTAATSERINAEANREVGKRVLAITGKDVDLKRPDLAAIVDTRFFDAELQFGGLFVYGRYLKHARDIPQTKWPCRRCQGGGCVRCGGTGKQYETSVEELVAQPFLQATSATEESFHGAGREDIDARCLGTGRPFILELKDPRVRTIDLSEFPARVAEGSGGRVEVRDLRFAQKDEVALIKEARGEKTYRAEVRFARAVAPDALQQAIATLKGATIEQRTPDRVSHRRADLVRKRQVIDIRVVAHEGDVCTLEVTGDAGLYIKELVNGDEGRTTPSLAGLLESDARVEALDIVAVAYD